LFVPQSDSPELHELLLQLTAKESPVRVQHQPEPGAIESDCFPTVDRKAQQEGGRRILGWQIWQTKLLIEAEFHAIWESPEGDLLDITPKPIALTHILFIPDSEANYEGRQIGNIRLNITGNALVDEFISIHDCLFRISNRGERADQYEISLKGREAEAYKVLSQAKVMVEEMATRGEGKKSSCICGSGKKYKLCHGKKVARIIREW
jgi:SEC-C motif